MRTVKIFRSKRREGTYLYVDAQEEFERVPQALEAQFGAGALVMALKLTSDRRLAQACAAEVLASIEARGFYLQLPPQVDPVTGEERGS